jgi:predicted nucleotidyltransferase
MNLFTERERNIVLERVIEIARVDNRVSGGALVGSFAKDSIDKWSDIDITFGIKSGFEHLTVLDEWTKKLKSEFKIIDDFDVRSASAIYRVILFSNGLELDLSVAPEVEYGPLSHNFKLLFGEAVPTCPPTKSVNNKLLKRGEIILKFP